MFVNSSFTPYRVEQHERLFIRMCAFRKLLTARIGGMLEDGESVEEELPRLARTKRIIASLYRLNNYSSAAV